MLSNVLYGNPQGFATSVDQLARGSTGLPAQLGTNMGHAYDASSGLARSGVERLKRGNVVAGVPQTIAGTIGQVMSPLTGVYETAAQDMDPFLQPDAGPPVAHAAPHGASASDIVPAALAGLSKLSTDLRRSPDLIGVDDARKQALAMGGDFSGIQASSPEFAAYVNNGRTYVGIDHASALKLAERSGENVDDANIENFGYVTHGGEFIPYDNPSVTSDTLHWQDSVRAARAAAIAAARRAREAPIAQASPFTLTPVEDVPP